MKTLNLLGLRHSESLISEEVERFCEYLGEKKGKVVQVDDLFNITVLTVLWKMTTGKIIEYEDATFNTIR